MIIKFNRPLSDFDVLVMFDLASKNTGVCAYDLKKRKVLWTDMVRVKDGGELPAAALEEELELFFKKRGLDNGRILFSMEAMPTQLRGGSSTVQTFIALARSHAVLDVFLYKRNACVYDYTGVYPATTHALFKEIKGLGRDDKVTKDDVKKYLLGAGVIKDFSVTLDESDAVFLCYGLLMKKWNNDISEQIRELKRHKKTLKLSKRISEVDAEIERLKNLMIKKEEMPDV